MPEPAPVASETCANAPQKLGKNAKNAKFQDTLTPKLSKITKNAKFQDTLTPKLGKIVKNAKFRNALLPKLSKIAKNAKFQEVTRTRDQSQAIGVVKEP